MVRVQFPAGAMFVFFFNTSRPFSGDQAVSYPSSIEMKKVRPACMFLPWFERQVLRRVLQCLG
jgi:hypothetical protein